MKKGMVYITGAGPGDPGLITVRGMESIRRAQVLVYDRLAGAGLLEQAPADCEMIYVGKESKNHTKTQDEINQILFEKAAEGKIVTRLKGGDPYVFGRGGEEALYLEERGISYQVIPGITSGIGGLAYSGIPITHRDYASSFHIITGHLKDENQELDWEILARLKGTLVFYMGMAQLGTITRQLMEHGMERSMPVALIQWATTANHRSVTGNLETIVNVAKAQNIGSPVLIVVGKVVELKEKLNFFEERPLLNKRILVTRSRAQSSRLSERIRRLGGEPVEFPMIRVEKTEGSTLKEAMEEISGYSWLVFTSQNGVDCFIDEMLEAGKDARSLGGVKIAAVGNATAKSLEKIGIRADLIPARFVGESLLEEMHPLLQKEDKVLLVQGEQSRSILKEGLEKYADVNQVVVYRTVKEDNWEQGDLTEYLSENHVDGITFTSSTTVTHLLEAYQGDLSDLQKIPLISIGPITTGTLEKSGLQPAKEASPHNMDGLMEALMEGVTGQ